MYIIVQHSLQGHIHMLDQKTHHLRQQFDDKTLKSHMQGCQWTTSAAEKLRGHVTQTTSQWESTAASAA